MFDKKELNIEEIKSLIPHRYPFLLIDRLIEIKPFESATGIKNVTINENYFQGHFENKAVMPGALIIESMAQSAGTLVLYSLKKTFENISVYLLSVDKAKFRKPVCPGDVLRMEVKKKNNVKNIWKFVCKSFVDNNLVAEAEIAAILSDINY
ncbi:MAG: 3-hydroxyacyl-[acyl-carrier-protein] dehydratase FabZ [Rickettsiales bacterium]|nr:3-hydroxyacyl-[acyl-carrier-protein] dehydratase FabZ [Rickettsiales bacterium]|tara:strand:- start:362 stop:817 length:456 start_codon:yes stop_codon:yes gene_type:complete